jgi:hypothetical protein
MIFGSAALYALLTYSQNVVLFFAGSFIGHMVAETWLELVCHATNSALLLPGEAYHSHVLLWMLCFTLLQLRLYQWHSYHTAQLLTLCCCCCRLLYATATPLSPAWCCLRSCECCGHATARAPSRCCRCSTSQSCTCMTLPHLQSNSFS